MPAQFVEVPVFTLKNGVKIPGVGLGCWMGTPGGGVAVEEMCKKAFKLGYRHFDTASGYGNEEHVGKAIRDSGIPRSQIFLTTKLGNGDHGRVQQAFETSLEKLNCQYIDLYLIHWPQAVNEDGKTLQPEEEPTYTQTWKDMIKLLDTGKVKAIGVSNFSVKTLEVLISQTNVVPAVNQVQMHPCLPDNELLNYCREKGIHVTAYSPLGRKDSPFFSDPTVKTVAEKNGITVSQVVLSWNVQRGVSVIPKSENEHRLRANVEIVKLDDEDFQLIDNLHKKPGMHRQLLASLMPNPDTGLLFGWTHDQLGWNLDRQGNWIQ